LPNLSKPSLAALAAPFAARDRRLSDSNFAILNNSLRDKEVTYYRLYMTQASIVNVKLRGRPLLVGPSRM